MIWILALQRLRFSKLSMTSGDHHSPQRYHHLMNSQSCVIIFFLLYHPTCQMQLNYDLLSSWVREGSAMVLHSRSNDAQRTLLEGTCPAAMQSWSPNLPQSPVNQIAIPAMWFNPVHGLACLNLQEVQVSALTSSLKRSLKSLKNMVFSFNCKEKQWFCPHASICTYDYVSKGYPTEPCSFAFPLLALPNISRFLYNIFGRVLSPCDVFSLLEMGRVFVLQSGFRCSSKCW